MRSAWPALLATLFLFVFLDPTGFVSDFIVSAKSNPDTVNLPYFIFRTLLRMTVAYILVSVFALTVGIITGLNKKAANFLIPIIDVLQDVPVLGFLPAVIIFFVNNFRGEMGLEMASILLIFTGMAWAPTLGVYGSAKHIPEEIKSMSKVYGMGRWRFIKNTVLPAIFPNYITHSMLAWGGGWYFLIAAEYISYGVQKYTLPGIGYYLANAVFNLGNVSSALLGLFVIVAIVASINIFIWRPLIDYSQRFKYELVASEAESGKESFLSKIVGKYARSEKERIFRFMDKFDAVANLITEKKFKKTPYVYHAMARSRTQRRYNPRMHAIRTRYAPVYKFIGHAIAFAFLIWILIFFLRSPPTSLLETAQKYPEVYNIPRYILFSFLRIVAAFIIALVWTTAAGFIIVRNKKLYNMFMPLFDIAQSIPALALFPFIVIVVIKSLGVGGIVAEMSSILLILTGAQWYMLFNIVSHLKAIPHDVSQLSKAYGMKGFSEFKNVILPAIFPGIVVGGIQAFGGAWNSLIVSEYILYGGEKYSVEGIGYFLNKAAWEIGDTTLVIITVVSMVLAIILVNRLLWKPLFDRAEKNQFEVY